MWQSLREELSPSGLEIVTVALDTDIEAARPFAQAAAPTHPSLVDQALMMVDMFGITNVPFGLWIDEDGMLVRPAEVAFAPRDERSSAQLQAVAAAMPPEQRAVIVGMMANTTATERYIDAVRDWATFGAQSRYVMTADEVVARSRPRPRDHAVAAAHFELGQHLHRAGFGRDAVAHFVQAHRLDPENWSYLRDALSIADPSWGQVYERDLLSEVAMVGVETFYPPLVMDPR